MAQDDPALVDVAAAPPGGAVRLLALRRFEDERGVLVTGELGTELPFTPVRVFAIHDVPEGARRADHANRVCAEVLVCLSGRCRAEVTDGWGTETFQLDDPQVGLFVPPLHWLRLDGFAPGSVLLVLASHLYDASTQVRDRDEFDALVRRPTSR